MTSRIKSLALVLVAAAILAVVGWVTLRGSQEQVLDGGNGLSDRPDVPSDLIPDIPELPADLPQTPPPDSTGFYSVFGRVVRFDGTPAQKVGVGVVRVWQGGADLYRLPAVRTGRDGAFRVEGVPVGEAMLALFPDLKPGLDENDLKRHPVVLTGIISGADGEDVDAGTISLGPSGAIAGIVLDEEGETCSRATVVVGRGTAGLGTRITRTNGHGRFRIEGLPAGEYNVQASAKVRGLEKGWRHKRIEGVSTGTTNLRIELRTPSAVVLVFHRVDAPNDPLLVRRGHLYPVGRSVAYSFGQARNPVPVSRWLVNLAPGSYHLKFTGEGYRPVDLGEVSILEEQETVLDVVLSPE